MTENRGRSTKVVKWKTGGVEMSRIPFSQVLKNAEIDLLQEYNRLYGLFYIQRIMNSTGLNTTLREYCNMSFGSVPYRKTCLSLDDFDDSFNYHFERVPSNFI